MLKRHYALIAGLIWMGMGGAFVLGKVSGLIDATVAAQTPTPSPPLLEWYYPDAERGDVFLVCVDGQATAACGRVLRTSSTTRGPAVDGSPSTLYTFKLPTLAYGDHRVSVQTCTLDASECTVGVVLNFKVTAEMRDVRGLRIVGGK